MKKELLMSLGVIGLMMSSNAAALTCGSRPSCETLGFNKTAVDCEGAKTLKCPFDQSKAFCKVDAASKAKPGDIYYSDGTISEDVIDGKTPVGVVAYNQNSHRFVISLDEKKHEWGDYDFEYGINFDVACLPDVSVHEELDMNGKTNTQCLLSDTQSSHPAAEYCNNLRAVVDGKGSGGWYLPAAGELYVMKFNFGAINLGLQKLSKEQISSRQYWSSTQSDYDDTALSANPANGSFSLSTDNYYNNPVRCALEF